MKHYVGTLEISSDSSQLRSTKIVLIAAKDQKQAEKLLDTFASEWEEGGTKTDVGYEYSTGDDPFVVEPIGVNAITPAAFHGMTGVARLGDEASDDLSAQDASEQTKTLARRLADQLKRLGVPCPPHSKLLEAVSASLGETDWQVLKHKGAGATQPLTLAQSLQPFSYWTADVITKAAIDLMGRDVPEAGHWRARAISLVEALSPVLCDLRDNHRRFLNVSVFRDYFSLQKLEELCWTGAEKYPGLQQVLQPLQSYVLGLPGYDIAKAGAPGGQSEDTQLEHGYTTMELVRAFTSLADSYGDYSSHLGRLPKNLPDVVKLPLGMAVHVHRHGEDVHLFQSVPTKDEAIEVVKAASEWEPQHDDSIHCSANEVAVDSSWLLKQLQQQSAVFIDEVKTTRKSIQLQNAAIDLILGAKAPAKKVKAKRRRP